MSPRMTNVAIQEKSKMPLMSAMVARTGFQSLSGKTPDRPIRKRIRIGIPDHLINVQRSTFVRTISISTPVVLRVSSPEQTTNEDNDTPKSKESARNTNRDHAARTTIFSVFVEGSPNNEHDKGNPQNLENEPCSYKRQEIFHDEPPHALFTRKQKIDQDYSIDFLSSSMRRK
jgi:hypothetical protein